MPDESRRDASMGSRKAKMVTGSKPIMVGCGAKMINAKPVTVAAGFGINMIANIIDAKSKMKERTATLTPTWR